MSTQHFAVTLRRWLTAAMCAVLLLVARTASADTLSLAWDPVSDPDVEGYYLFIGTSSGTYSTVIDVGNTTGYTYTTANPGTTYYVSVAAYTAGPVVGSHSPEVIATTSGGPMLTNPGNQTNRLGDTVTLTLRATDPNNDPITFGALGLPPGLTLNPTVGVISGSPTINGAFPVSVTASDTNANIATQAFTWTIGTTDASAPTIAITSPTRGATWSTTSNYVTLSGTGADDVGVTSVTWSSSRGGSGTAAGTTAWSVVVPLLAGSNAITMTARDASGKSSATTITVAYDTTAPTARITSPTINATYTATASTITFSGTSTDDVGVTQVTWSTNRGATGVAAGSSAWSATLTLPSGSTAVTFTARDAAGRFGTATITVSVPGAALRLTSFTASLPAPQPANTAITFTATAADGVAPYQYKFMVFNGSTWALLRDWGTTNTYTWRPSTNNQNYRVRVWIRNAGNVTDAPQNSSAAGEMAFPITASNALAVTGLTPNVTSPRAPGTSITWSATATGGAAPYQYKFRVFVGGLWTVARTWSTTNTFTWTPTVAGSYQVEVWARNATNTNDAPQNANADLVRAFTIQAPLALSNLVSTLPAPQVAGRSITFDASANGGTAPYQFKYRLYNGSTWTTLQAWSTNNRATWTPTTANANYRVEVWVRSAGSTTDAPENASSSYGIAFPISAAAPLGVTYFSSNLASPQRAGTTVTFTASAAGGIGPYQYKFRVYNGSTWTVAQTWSASNLLLWTPTTPGSYQVEVWVRGAYTTTDAPETAAADVVRTFSVN